MKIYRSLFTFLAVFLLCFCTTLPAMAQKKKHKKKNKLSKNEKLLREEVKLVLDEREQRFAEQLFIEGMKFYVMEEYPKAIDKFEESRKVNPKSATTFFQLGKAYLNLEKPEKALFYAETALKIDDKNTYHYFLLIAVYSALQQDENTEKMHKSLIKIEAKEEYYFELASFYLRKQQIDNALNVYGEMDKKFGHSQEIIRRKQLLYLQTGDIESALKEGEVLIENFPQEPVYKLRQVELLLNEKETEQAKKLLTTITESGIQNPSIHLLQAQIYENEKNVEGQIEELKKAFASQDLSENIKLNLLKEYYNRAVFDKNWAKTGLNLTNIALELHDNPNLYVFKGHYLLLQEKIPEGREAYVKSLERHENNYEIWQTVLQLDTEIRDYDKLLKTSEDALEIFPNQSTFWYYNGTAHWFKNNYEEAAFALEQGKRLLVGNPTFLGQFEAQMGDVYNALKKYNKSDAAFENALKLNPANPHVLNNYSYFLSIRRKKLDKAEEMAEKLLALEPNNPTYLDTYGWVLYAAQKFDKASVQLEKAAKASPTSATITEHYGDVLFKTKKEEEALIQWKKAKELGSESKFIDKKISEKKLFE
jgi:tetratricopeptide (TPR) repeat protein